MDNSQKLASIAFVLAAAVIPNSGRDVPAFPGAEGFGAKVTIKNARAQQASFDVPNEPEKQLHIILELTDHGTPPLTRYERVICTIQ